MDRGDLLKDARAYVPEVCDELGRDAKYTNEIWEATIDEIAKGFCSDAFTQ